MEMIKCCSIVISAMIAVIAISTSPSSGQITTACAGSLISSFTPCFNYITGSINGGGSPTADCCKALGSLISSSSECACLIVTGNVPLNLPINRTLAITLPRMCKSQSVPLQCQASSTSLPGPGPITYGPSLPPLPSTGSGTGSDTTPPIAAISQPASPPVSESPLNQGQRPLVIPSSSVKLPHVHSLVMLMLVVLGTMLSS